LNCVLCDRQVAVSSVDLDVLEDQTSSGLETLDI
jgi:hypothetical protein